MESFFSFLEKRVDDCSSLLCVGLDPHVSDLPKPTPTAALDFCLNIVEQTAPYAAAFKPNAAFFEQFGAEGMAALRDVVSAVPAEVPVLLDAKRGDIASNAEAYARAAFETLGADAISGKTDRSHGCTTIWRGSGTEMLATCFRGVGWP